MGGQSLELKWLPIVKTAKDQHTIQLLHAGPDGFYLLRWQDRRTDIDGRITPAMPLLTVLSPAGEKMHDDPLPGFAGGEMVFRFAVSNGPHLLVAYEAPDALGRQALFVNRLDLAARQWAHAPEAVFHDLSGRAPAFSTAWYGRSADGRRVAIYLVRGGRTPTASVAVFDTEAFKLLWSRETELPSSSGLTIPGRVMCTDSGAVLIQAGLTDAGKGLAGTSYNDPPSVYRSDGRPMFRAREWTDEAPAGSNALYLLQAGDAEIAAFYPAIGKKFTPSVELAEDSRGQLYAVGFTGNSGKGSADGYFVYAIDPRSKQASLLQNAPLPASVRQVFLNKKSASEKAPVENLGLRWLDWGADGRPWILAEQADLDVPPGRVEVAALLRLDSTYRITAARKIEKYQRLSTGDAQNFASLAACAMPKGGWWFLWNQGNWPEAKLLLTECRNNGEPEEFMLSASSQSNVALLPQTLFRQGDAWYFVGESEYHERFRIGVLRAAGKK